MTKAARKSLSYHELMQTDPEELARLATADQVDLETRARLAHIGRFFGCIAARMPSGADLKVGDVLTEDDLQAIWRATAHDAKALEAMARPPLLH
jgi:hypothetical protein